MPSTEKGPVPEQRRPRNGSTWPVLAGTVLILLLLPLRAGLGVLLDFTAHPPFWELSRASGLLAYLCLWLSAVSGAVGRFPLPAWLRPLQMEVHQWAGVWAAYVGLFHAVILLGSTYLEFTWRDVLVPFGGTYKPELVSLGTISMYGLVLVAISTYLRANLSASAWRWLHALSYPAYALALWHGVALGTDTQVGWVKAFYIGTTAALILLIIARLTYQPASPPKRPEAAGPRN